MSDRQFTADVFRGTRSWKMRDDGWLTGCALGSWYQWTPGENEATCLVKTGLSMRKKEPYQPSAKAFWIPEEGARPHDPGSIQCNCGFHAMYDGAVDYTKPDYVDGIIEGYGHVAAGSRGFRASKARIVALVAPRYENVFAPLLKNAYPDVPIFDTLALALVSFPPSR